PQFITCNRGVIVNLDMVKKPDGSYFLMKDNTKVFISRSKVAETKKQYADYIFSKTRGDTDV
ncbi:MAG: LytTR family transcriptional regulator, partial [Clostridiales bacterium]|nr:LytTR family transcriptional regulator [Clostridiales bacterium]